MTTQWIRKAALYLTDPATGKALDLSEFHYKFKCSTADTESPNNASVRVYNLKPETVKKVQGEYSTVVLQAGYEGNFGQIFKGTIKQYRIGRENATDTYLDILAADGDLGYNFSVANATLSADNSGVSSRVDAIMQGFGKHDVKPGVINIPNTGGVLPRGKVLFGMARTMLRQQVWSAGATWSIQNGKINITPLDGYLPGSAVVINALTGMIGMPESTIDGIKVRVLMNPRIQAGLLIKIDNASINKTLQTNPSAPIPYNQYTGIQLLASVAADNLYRVYSAEFEGDTRGQPFYTDIVALALNADTNKVIANG